MSKPYEVELRTQSPFLLFECADVGSIRGLVMQTSAPYSNQESSKGAILMGAKPVIEFVHNDVAVEADYDSETSKLDSIIRLGTPARGIYISSYDGGYFANAESEIHVISLTVSHDYLAVGFLSSDNETFLSLDVDKSILGFAVDALHSRICKKIVDYTN